MRSCRSSAALGGCLLALLALLPPAAVRAQAPADGPPGSGPASLAATLHAFSWRPLRARDAHGRELAALRGASARGLWARFRPDGWYELRSVCNSAGGGYRLGQGRLLGDPQRAVVQTTAGCARRGDEAMETAFFELMAVGARLSLEAGAARPVLTLRRDDGRRIELVGQPLDPAAR